MLAKTTAIDELNCSVLAGVCVQAYEFSLIYLVFNFYYFNNLSLAEEVCSQQLEAIEYTVVTAV